MKLIIQIPCYNEEETLPVTLKDLPRKIEGVDEIEILIINDGSLDRTEQVARTEGLTNILSLPYRHGLARAFALGMNKSLQSGADIIVNTDADNQYRGEDIPKLIRPILDKKAEIVIGCRDISAIRHFSLFKKILQRLGSFIVRKISNTTIPDTTSGFRAYSKNAALKLNIFSTYTYTLESIIEAGRKEIPMSYIAITTNDKLRESRLISSVPSYILKSVVTILRIYLMYEPLKTFSCLGLIFTIPGSLLILRYLYYYVTVPRSGHMQSLVIASVLIILGLGITLLGLLGDIISANRRLSEELLYRMKKESLKRKGRNVDAKGSGFYL